jgi:hypothetical protein
MKDAKTRSAADMRQHARQYAPEAIERLVYWLRSEDPRASVASASLLLDRGFGKALQVNEVSGLDGAPLMPTLSVTLTQAQPLRIIEAEPAGDGNGERG